MSRINLEYRAYRRLFRRPLRTARGDWSVREGWIVRLECDGLAGYGEVAPLAGFGCEALDEAGRLLAAFPARFEDDGAVEARLAGAPPCCAFALRSALDQLRRAADDDGIPVFAVAALLPAGGSAPAELARRRDAGYRVFKWKIAVEEPAAEFDWLAALVAALPPGGQLRLDANGGLDAAGLERWLEVLDDCSEAIGFLEQPLPPGEEEAMWSAAAGAPVAIALDESLNHPAGRRWLEPGAWSGPLVLKPALMGDPHRLGPFDPDDVVLSSVFETAVGARNALDALARWGGSSRAAGFDTLGAFEDELSVGEPSPRLAAEDFPHARLEQVWRSIAH